MSTVDATRWMRQEYGRCGYKVPAAVRRSEMTLRERSRMGQFLRKYFSNGFWEGQGFGRAVTGQ
jgi:hypothetical protein